MTGTKLLLVWSAVVALALGLLGLPARPALGPPAARADDTSACPWDLPAWLPPPLVPADNPMTAEKVALGRHLFYDPRLSVTGEMACATCPQQARAFTDGRPQAIGATGAVHPRNAMGLANVAYSPTLTWANPQLTRLEQQALIPMFGEDPVEMGLAGREAALFATLRADPVYQRLFAAAFPEEAELVTLATITRALAAFQRPLLAADAPYDRYRYGGEPHAISAAAKRGEALFFSERLECFHCHGGLHFTDNVQHARLAFPETAFHNTGLYNLDGQGAYPARNTGLHALTGRAEDMGRFRTPSLRNVARTAPYMHDGSVPTLDAAIDHYAAGGRTVYGAGFVSEGRLNPFKSPFVRGFPLTAAARADLLALLDSLTDAGFVTNPRFGDPWPLSRGE